MKKKLLGILLASVAVLTAIGAAGLANQSIGAAPGEVPVYVQIGDYPAYMILHPVDTSGIPLVTEDIVNVEISHYDIYKLEVYDCYGSAIQTCPTGLQPAATLTNDGRIGLDTLPVNLTGKPTGLHRLFVLGYGKDGVAIDGGKWVEIYYKDEGGGLVSEPLILLQSINGMPFEDQHAAQVNKNEIELTLSYSNVDEIEIWDGDRKLDTRDCTIADPRLGTLRCKFTLEGGLDGVTHNLNIRYHGLDGEWVDHALALKVLGPDVPGTGVIKIGGLTVGREDLMVSALVLVLAVAIGVFFFTLRRGDVKRSRRTARRSTKR